MYKKIRKAASKYGAFALPLLGFYPPIAWLAIWGPISYIIIERKMNKMEPSKSILADSFVSSVNLILLNATVATLPSLVMGVLLIWNRSSIIGGSALIILWVETALPLFWSKDKKDDWARKLAALTEARPS